jgi:hypothetical protein
MTLKTKRGSLGLGHWERLARDATRPNFQGAATFLKLPLKFVNGDEPNGCLDLGSKDMDGLNALAIRELKKFGLAGGERCLSARKPIAIRFTLFSFDYVANAPSSREKRTEVEARGLRLLPEDAAFHCGEMRQEEPSFSELLEGSVEHSHRPFFAA